MRGRLPLSRALLGGLAGICLGLVCIGAVWLIRQPKTPLRGMHSHQPAREFTRSRKLTAWWDDPPAQVQAGTVISGSKSNIHPSDYVGPEACKECHAQNF